MLLAVSLGENGPAFPPMDDVIPKVLVLSPDEDARYALRTILTGGLMSSTDYFPTLSLGFVRIDSIVALIAHSYYVLREELLRGGMPPRLSDRDVQGRLNARPLG